MRYPSIRSVFKKWCREVRALKEPRQTNPTVTISDPRGRDVSAEASTGSEVTFKFPRKGQ